MIFKRIQLFLIIIQLCVFSPLANAGFWTGFAVGTLYSSTSPQEVDNDIKELRPYSEKLYLEFKKNELIIKNNGGKNVFNLKRRNEQILAELIQQAKNDYLESFVLVLIPESQEVIEKIEIKPDPIGIIIQKLEHYLFGSKPTKDTEINQIMKRKKILYKVMFTEDSPQPIQNFNVTNISGSPIYKKNNTFYYNYSEVWGDNIIQFSFQHKDIKGLKFVLDYHYDIEAPDDVNKGFSQDNSLNSLNSHYALLITIFSLSFIIKLLSASLSS